jgi:hypothetical protein
MKELGAGVYLCEFTASDALGHTAKRKLAFEVE